MVRFVLAAVVVHFHPVHYLFVSLHLFVSLRHVLHQGLVLVRAELGSLRRKATMSQRSASSWVFPHAAMPVILTRASRPKTLPMASNDFRG
jgi:hypothetical protein